MFTEHNTYASVLPTIFDRNNIHSDKHFGSQLGRRAETHVVFMQCPLFSLDFNPKNKAVKSFIKFSHIKFYENPFGGSRVAALEQTDTQPTGTFRCERAKYLVFECNRL